MQEEAAFAPVDREVSRVIIHRIHTHLIEPAAAQHGIMAYCRRRWKGEDNQTHVACAVVRPEMASFLGTPMPAKPYLIEGEKWPTGLDWAVCGGVLSVSSQLSRWLAYGHRVDAAQKSNNSSGDTSRHIE